MRLTLINHACCKLEAGSSCVLFDPWIEGPVFNQGWDLLIPTPLRWPEIMAGVTHIWISHEHPDHFSAPFLAEVAERGARSITVLFQETRDGRVARHCRGLGLKVQELDDRAALRLDAAVTLVCGASDFYDSWLYVSDGRHSLLNLNDCPIRDERGLRDLARCVPRPTVLLSQFSYAAWKGGRANRAFRETAAREKLEVLARQVRVLKPQFAIPFASFIYFSNVENRYLNDAVNTPRTAAAAIAQGGAQPVVLYPGDAWAVGDARHDNASALRRYEAAYAEIGKRPFRSGGASASLDELAAAFAEYRRRVFARNSRAVILLLRKLPLLGAFRPLTVRLGDLDRSVSLSVVDGFAALPDDAEEPDVVMHSSSLLFIFRNEFGFDTLTVNGRFEATEAGFAKMTRALSVGSLNALGLSLSLRLFGNLRVVGILLRRLKGVLLRMRRGAAGAA